MRKFQGTHFDGGMKFRHDSLQIWWAADIDRQRVPRPWMRV
ncbi:hypothetical protein PAMC26510_02960 [Caballeronia sordidicola]|uniref:Uncharacterized protein n=1 Tax=Caballeronia sordidicola TaxID=196367 RepID=A0A242NA58_CABSO|nr:hypothetical protein PAMC26510_02960 [Caballeronia sordidicola]